MLPQESRGIIFQKLPYPAIVFRAPVFLGVQILIGYFIGTGSSPEILPKTPAQVIGPLITRMVGIDVEYLSQMAIALGFRYLGPKGCQ